jgi:hypothetical protein
MKTIELVGEVDGQHRLHAQVPPDVPPGKIRLSIIVPSGPDVESGEDERGAAWADGIAGEWTEELGDSRQDIYTIADGEPVDESP